MLSFRGCSSFLRAAALHALLAPCKAKSPVFTPGFEKLIFRCTPQDLAPCLSAGCRTSQGLFPPSLLIRRYSVFSFAHCFVQENILHASALFVKLFSAHRAKSG
jgi:hypothetical protein